VFDDTPDRRWETMAGVLAYSLGVNGHTCRVIRTDGPEGRVDKVSSNVSKLQVWNEVVQAATRPVLLLDADMVCLRSLAGEFDAVEHVGITWRDPRWKAVSPLNAGCVFVRPTEWAKAFFRKWVQVDARVERDGPFRQRYRKTWSGQNQAALGAMIEHGMAEQCTRLECQRVNLVEPWCGVEDAGILHVKHRLMWMCFDGFDPQNEWEAAALAAWRTWHAAWIMNGGNIPLNPNGDKNEKAING